jgi:hypothetical protein
MITNEVALSRAVKPPKKRFYRKSISGEGKTAFCVYCGDWWQCRDHVIPLSWLRVYRNYRVSETVHCCDLCNKLAGSFPAQSIEEKAFHLQRRYENKFKRLLSRGNSPWTRQGLSELHGWLRHYCTTRAILRQVVERKLINLAAVSLGFPAKPFRDDNL